MGISMMGRKSISVISLFTYAYCWEYTDLPHAFWRREERENWDPLFQGYWSWASCTRKVDPVYQAHRQWLKVCGFKIWLHTLSHCLWDWWTISALLICSAYDRRSWNSGSQFSLFSSPRCTRRMGVFLTICVSREKGPNHNIYNSILISLPIMEISIIVECRFPPFN